MAVGHGLSVAQQPLCGSDLQVRNTQNPKSIGPKRGLHVLLRSSGRIPRNWYRPRRQEVLHVQPKRKTSTRFSPTLRLERLTLRVCKNHEGHGERPTLTHWSSRPTRSTRPTGFNKHTRRTGWGKRDCAIRPPSETRWQGNTQSSRTKGTTLHGRLLSALQNKIRGPGSQGTRSGGTGVYGIEAQRGQRSLGSDSAIGASWHGGRHSQGAVSGNTNPITQASQPGTGDNLFGNTDKQINPSSEAGSIHWPSPVCVSSSTSSETLLAGVARLHANKDQLELESTLNSTGPERSGMVGAHAYPLERSSHLAVSNDSSTAFGRIHAGLGRSAQRHHSSQRFLERIRALKAHHRVGIAGGPLRHQVLPTSALRPTRLHARRQPGCSAHAGTLQQQEPSHHAKAPSPVSVVGPQQHHSHRGVHSVRGKHLGGSTFSRAGHRRLAVEPRGLRADRESFRPTHSGPICFSHIRSTGSLQFKVARPLLRASRQSTSRLARREQLRQPTLDVVASTCTEAGREPRALYSRVSTLDRRSVVPAASSTVHLPVDLPTGVRLLPSQQARRVRSSRARRMEHSRVSSGLVPGFVHLRGTTPHLPQPQLSRVSAARAGHRPPVALDSRVADVVVGSRLEILLSVAGSQEQQYFPGTVTSLDRLASPVTHHILYDDGDKEDLVLQDETFRVLPADVVAPGSSDPFWRVALKQRWQAELEGTPDEEQADIIETLSRALSDGSRSTYSSPQNQYFRFCMQHSLVALPGRLVTVLRFLRHLKKRNTVEAGSLQVYLSAINKLHIDSGLDPPVVGPAITDFRKGLGRQQQESGHSSDDRLRVYLPAEIVLLVRNLGLDMCSSGVTHLTRSRNRQLSLVFRSLVITVFSYCTFTRSDTQTQLEFQDLWVTSLGLHVTLRHFKGKIHFGHIKPLLFPPGAVKGLEELVTSFLHLQGSLGASQGSNFWRFPWETRSTWPASLGDDWLQLALQQIPSCPSPPPGMKWTGHSTRKGATTSAAAIGVVDTVYYYVGDWSIKSSARLDYIDPTATPSPAMLEFLGWLLPTVITTPP